MIAWISDPMNLAQLAAAVVAVCSVLDSILPDDSGLMKLISKLAFNIGKAANDPAKQ